MLRWIFFFLLFVSAISGRAQRSFFNNSAECWTITGDATGFSYGFVGGNPGGYIRAEDMGQGQAWYFVAPSYFLGDKTASFGHTLSYDQRTSHPGTSSNKDIIITGGGIKIWYDVPNNPGVNWTHISVVLDVPGWKYVGSNMPVTLTDFMTVLSDITEIRIRAEFSSSLDEGALDNVVMEPIGDISSNAAPVCESGCFDFLDETTTNPQAWQWYFPGAVPNTSQQHNPTTICYPAAGQYTALLVQYNGCYMDTFRIPGIVVYPREEVTVNRVFCHDTVYTFPDGSSTQRYGEYHDTLQSVHGCDSVVTWKVWVAPQLSVDVQVENAVCHNEASGGVTLQTSGGWSPLTYAVNGNAGNQPDYDQLAAGIYHYQVSDSLGCMVTGDFSITQPPPLAFSIAADAYVKECHTPLTLQVSSPLPDAVFSWSPSDYLSCFTCPDPVSEATANTQYNITVTAGVEGHLCSADTQITVLVIPVFYIPNAFTPNYDVLNDTYSIRGDCWDGLRDFRFCIFNRWGEKLFEASSPDFEWGMEYQGQPLPPGMYIYRMEYTLLHNGKVQTATGSITLLR